MDFTLPACEVSKRAVDRLIDLCQEHRTDPSVDSTQRVYLSMCALSLDVLWSLIDRHGCSRVRGAIEDAIEARRMALHDAGMKEPRTLVPGALTASNIPRVVLAARRLLDSQSPGAGMDRISSSPTSLSRRAVCASLPGPDSQSKSIATATCATGRHHVSGSFSDAGKSPDATDGGNEHGNMAPRLPYSELSPHPGPTLLQRATNSPSATPGPPSTRGSAASSSRTGASGWSPRSGAFLAQRKRRGLAPLDTATGGLVLQQKRREQSPAATRATRAVRSTERGSSGRPRAPPQG